MSKFSLLFQNTKDELKSTKDFMSIFDVKKNDEKIENVTLGTLQGIIPSKESNVKQDYYNIIFEDGTNDFIDCETAAEALEKISKNKRQKIIKIIKTLI
jgi:hypothetical protein